MKNDPVTILITVGAEQGFSLTHTKPRFASNVEILYMCEGVESLLNRLIKVLDLSFKYEVIIKEKEK